MLTLYRVGEKVVAATFSILTSHCVVRLCSSLDMFQMHNLPTSDAIFIQKYFRGTENRSQEEDVRVWASRNASGFAKACLVCRLIWLSCRNLMVLVGFLLFEASLILCYFISQTALPDGH